MLLDLTGPDASVHSLGNGKGKRAVGGAKGPSRERQSVVERKCPKPVRDCKTFLVNDMHQEIKEKETFERLPSTLCSFAFPELNSEPLAPKRLCRFWVADFLPQLSKGGKPEHDKAEPGGLLFSTLVCCGHGASRGSKEQPSIVEYLPPAAGPDDCILADFQ